MNWVGFALMTVAFWGLYGVFLHKGSMKMADPEFGRYKAFLVVGIAYFLVAVLAPLILLKVSGSNLKFTGEGFKWSLIAGTVGAIGALGVLLAFGKGGPPAAVMSIIFAGAPVVNAVVALKLHPPAGGLAAIGIDVDPKFAMGLAVPVALGLAVYGVWRTRKELAGHRGASESKPSGSS